MKALFDHPILRRFKNFYVFTGSVFVLWMLFFDSNNLYNQLKMAGKIDELEVQKEYYKEMIEQVQKDKKELTSDPAQLEKFAREKYVFKRRGEDVYVLQKKD